MQPRAGTLYACECLQAPFDLLRMQRPQFWKSQHCFFPSPSSLASLHATSAARSGRDGEGLASLKPLLTNRLMLLRTWTRPETGQVYVPGAPDFGAPVASFRFFFVCRALPAGGYCEMAWPCVRIGSVPPYSIS